MSSETLVVERTFNADCATLYDAWTDPAVMAKWFFVDEGGRAEVKSDLRVGGRYELKMIFPGDVEHTMHGEYLELEPHRRVRFTWNSAVATGTEVTVEFEAIGDRSRLRLTHAFIDSDELRRRHAHGWGGCLDNLHRLLGNPVA